MDWENERYVRLYTRDSLTWKLWSWEARAILCLLLRKVDRAGVLDIGDHEPADAIAAICDLPCEVCAIGVPQLLKSKTLIVNNGQIAISNFLEAQEARASNRERQRRFRERRRKSVTQRYDESHGVTDSNDSSHGITGSNSVSHGVTKVTPSLAKPSQLNKSDKPPANPTATQDAERALEMINESRGKFMQVRKTRSKALVAKARTFLREHTLDDLRHVLDTWEDDCTKGANGDYDPLKHFGAMTVLRPSSYLKRLDRPGKAQATKSSKPRMSLAEARRMFPDASDADLQRSFGGVA